MAKIRVLVFPCGAENGIEIHQALKDVINVELFGVSSRDDHGTFVFKNCVSDLPLYTEDGFLPAFEKLLEEQAIDVVFPTHDDIAVHLARHRGRFRSKIAVPGPEQAELCRSKFSTYSKFEGEEFVPKVFRSVTEVDRFPVFAKPDKGQGGKGALLINDATELRAAFAAPGLCVTEYLPGNELTVDCFSDRYGELRFIGPRTRERVFGGISVRTTVVAVTDEIRYIAERLNKGVGMRGLWYFQVKEDTAGRSKLLEVSVRTAGSMGLYRGMGVNFPLLTIYDLLDMDVSILKNEGRMQMDRALSSKFRSDLQYDVVYVDYDETIIKNGHVNWFVMLFLYNARARGKRIRLISKHAGDLMRSLEEHAIHARLFEEIIHLQPEDRKHEHIKDATITIFIDNAFKERAEMRSIRGVPVFDVDAIGALIDWKE